MTDAVDIAIRREALVRDVKMALLGNTTTWGKAQDLENAIVDLMDAGSYPRTAKRIQRRKGGWCSG